MATGNSTTGSSSLPLVSHDNRESIHPAPLSLEDIVSPMSSTTVDDAAAEAGGHTLAKFMEEQQKELMQLRQQYESLSKQSQTVSMENAELRKQIELADDTTKKVVQLGKRKRPRYEQYNDENDRDLVSSQSSVVPSSIPPTLASSQPPSGQSSSPPSSLAAERANEDSGPKIKIEPSIHKFAFNKLINRSDPMDLTQDGDDNAEDGEPSSDPSKYVFDLPAYHGRRIDDPKVPSSYLRGVYFNDAVLLRHPGLQKAIEWRFHREETASQPAIHRAIQKKDKQSKQQKQTGPRKLHGMLQSK